MKPQYNKSEIFALAHKFRRESLGPYMKPQSFASCLKRAWTFARQTMNGIQSRISKYNERLDDYGSSYVVVMLPWSRYEEFRTGIGARKTVPMPEPMADWFNRYGAH